MLFESVKGDTLLICSRTDMGLSRLYMVRQELTKELATSKVDLSRL